MNPGRDFKEPHSVRYSGSALHKGHRYTARPIGSLKGVEFGGILPETAVRLLQLW